MKKYLPLILLGVGLLAVVGVILFLRGRNKTEPTEEAALVEIPLNERPVASLTPSDDGHWLKLTISKLVVDAASLDYELLYKLPDGRTQGVPGTIKLEGQDEIERDLLLGSESSGKFRYDEGVENGTLTIRLRNDKGRLLARFTTDFHLQTAERELTTVDEEFTATLTRSSNEFFVTMETFGIPADLPGELVSGPYGVFTSATDAINGEVSLSGTPYRFGGSSWIENFDEATGIFVGTSQ